MRRVVGGGWENISRRDSIPASFLQESSETRRSSRGLQIELHAPVVPYASIVVDYFVTGTLSDIDLTAACACSIEWM